MHYSCLIHWSGFLYSFRYSFICIFIQLFMHLFAQVFSTYWFRFSVSKLILHRFIYLFIRLLTNMFICHECTCIYLLIYVLTYYWPISLSEIEFVILYDIDITFHRYRVVYLSVRLSLCLKATYSENVPIVWSCPK